VRNFREIPEKIKKFCKILEKKSQNWVRKPPQDRICLNPFVNVILSPFPVPNSVENMGKIPRIFLRASLGSAEKIIYFAQCIKLHKCDIFFKRVHVYNTMNKIIKVNYHTALWKMWKKRIFDMKKEKVLLQDKTNKCNYLNCLIPFINACIFIYTLIILI